MTRSPWQKKLLVLAAVIFIGGVFVALRGAAYFLAPADSSSNQKIVYEVTPNQTPHRVSKELEEKGIIKKSDYFLLAGKITRSWSKLKAGEYELSPKLSPAEVLRILTSGRSVSRSVTIREGENIFQIAKRLEENKLARASEFLKLCRDRDFITSLGFGTPTPPSMEGYLFPETYFFNKSQGAKGIIRKMYGRFRFIWDETMKARAEELKLNRHEVITLASIIEKETGAPEERPLISSVFHNRLKKRMRLQSDPTTIYGIWETFNGNLRRKHLRQETPYNTYAIKGLPIGPIGNPGVESIKAALHPKTSSYLYFVSMNDGTHKFSKTVKEHNIAVRKYQKSRKARRGKSWRDLHKKKNRAKASRS